MALEYFEPDWASERAIKWSFVIREPGANEAQLRITCGSYEPTHQLWKRSNPDAPEGTRYYCLDVYRQGAHESLGFHVGQPEYNAVKQTLQSYLRREHRPVSSTTYE